MKNRKQEQLEILTACKRTLFMVGYVLWDELVLSVTMDLGFTLAKCLLALCGGALLHALGALPQRKTAAFGLQSAACICVSVLYVSQSIYFSIFHTPYYLKSLLGLGKALEFSDVALRAAAKNAGMLTAFAVQLLLMFTVYRKWFWQRVQRPPCAFSLLTAIWMCTLALCLSLSDGREPVSPRMQLLQSFVPSASLRTFGLLPTMALDVKFNFLHLMQEIPKPVEDLPDDPVSVSSPETVWGENVLSIDFNTEETDAVFREMNAWFGSRTPTQKNEYTGLFQGKNLILLTCEGFSDALIDPIQTPTLHKLYSEGFRFHNFYTPVWGVSTSDGEFVATTGLLPKTGVWSYTEIADNSMPFALGVQFAKQGKPAFAFHGHDYTYYNRDRSYPAMGYVYYGQGNGLDLTKQWPESDVEMVEQSLPFYIEEETFHVYYMTISGHLGYTFSGNRMASKHREQVEDLPYGEEVRAYIACQMELEDALALLVSRLDQAGQLENTVIALSADHYPYGLTNEQYAQLRGREALAPPFELYENGFLLWTPGMEPVDVEVPCSSLDILPTLSNLFGLPYDSRLMMGTDVFSGTSPMVLFADHSFITERFCYDAGSGQIQPLNDAVVSQKEVEQCIREMEQRFTYSARIIETDYYGYLLRSGRMKESAESIR